jgi:hypothetical protein
MRANAVYWACALSGVLLCSGKTLAGVVYEAGRFDGQTSQRDFEIRVLLDEREARADVSIDGHVQISMLQSGHTITLIDHVHGVYVVRDTRRDPSAAGAIAWQPTSRHLFALGSYCETVESYWSETVYQEECSKVEPAAPTDGGGIVSRTRVGEFLRLVAASSDPASLFDLAARGLMRSRDESTVPLIIRHFEAGKLVGEVRVLHITNRLLAAKSFDVPRGLRRISQDATLVREASR